MSWNRPSESQAEVRGGGRAKRSRLRGLVAAAIVVGGAVVAWLLLAPSPSRPQPVSSDSTKRIREVEPAKPKVVTPAPGMVLSTNRQGKVYEHPATNQYGCPWNWGPSAKLKPDVITRLDRSKLPIEERVFKNGAERAIAGLLLVEPGQDLIGSDEPSAWFLTSFKRSLENPVVIEPDDTDEVRELKQAVLETKAELKARMDKGEDIVKIMTETRRELRELGAYREELEKQVKAYFKKGDITAQDLRDMVDAANTMLENRGAAKIVMPEFYYHQIDYRNKMRKAREKQNEQK